MLHREGAAFLAVELATFPAGIRIAELVGAGFVVPAEDEQALPAVHGHGRGRDTTGPLVPKDLHPSICMLQIERP